MEIIGRHAGNAPMNTLNIDTFPQADTDSFSTILNNQNNRKIKKNVLAQITTQEQNNADEKEEKTFTARTNAASSFADTKNQLQNLNTIRKNNKESNKNDSEMVSDETIIKPLKVNIPLGLQKNLKDKIEDSIPDATENLVDDLTEKISLGTFKKNTNTTEGLTGFINKSVTDKLQNLPITNNFSEALQTTANSVSNNLNDTLENIDITGLDSIINGGLNKITQNILQTVNKNVKSSLSKTSELLSDIGVDNIINNSIANVSLPNYTFNNISTNISAIFEGFGQDSFMENIQFFHTVNRQLYNTNLTINTFKPNEGTAQPRTKVVQETHFTVTASGEETTDYQGKTKDKIIIRFEK